MPTRTRTINRPKAIEHLKEAARYCRSDFEASLRHLDQAIAEINVLGFRAAIMEHTERILRNLMVAQQYIQVEPDVARGYMLAAAFELSRREPI